MGTRSVQDWQMWGPKDRPRRTISPSVFYFMFVHRKVILHKTKTNGRGGGGWGEKKKKEMYIIISYTNRTMNNQLNNRSYKLSIIQK